MKLTIAGKVCELSSARVVEDREEALQLLQRDPTRLASLDDAGNLRVRQVARGGTISKERLRNAPDVPTGDALQSLVEGVGVPWQDDYAERVVPYWASDERVDAHGDIVLQNWVFDDFSKNSPLGFSHEWGELSIGRVVGWETADRTDPDYKGPALWLLALFATAEQFGWADTVFRMVSAGFFPAGSVGFWSGVVVHVENDEERAALGLGRWGVILDENHLLEYSPTFLGANAGAISLTDLAAASRKGQLKANDISVLRELERRECLRTGRHDDWKRADTRLRALAKGVFSKSRFEQHSDIEQPFEHGTVDLKGLHTLRTAAEETEVTDQPPTLEERVQAIEDGLRTLAVKVEDGFTTLGSTLGDVLETVEDISTASIDVEDDDTEADTEQDAEGAEFNRRLDAFLSKIPDTTPQEEQLEA